MITGLVVGFLVGVVTVHLVQEYLSLRAEDEFGGPLSDEWQPGRTEERK
jgi:hypothetical protein